MHEATVYTAEQEADLLQYWFDTVSFDQESPDLPPLSPERDDEERSANPVTEPNPGLSKVEFDDLMAELRKRDPENPF